MALLLIDSFADRVTDQIRQKGYSRSFGNQSIQPTTGRRDNPALRFSGAPGSPLVYSLPVASSESLFVGGMAWETGTWHNEGVWSLKDTVGSTIASISITDLGECKVSAGGQSALSSSSIIIPNVYSYLELVVYRHDTLGYAEIWKDSSLVCELRNIDTDNGNLVGGFSFGGQPYTFNYTRFTDMYFLDSSGTRNNARLGDIRVDIVNPISDGLYTDFTPQYAGDNFLMVDEALADEDTTYVQAGAIGRKDTYTMANPIFDTEIYGTQLNIQNRKTDAGSVYFDAVVEKPGGTGEKILRNEPVNDEYKVSTFPMDYDPDDNTIWTNSKIAAQGFGYRLANIIT